MILEGFGIKLEILTEESAEIVRQWRNQPEILDQMEFNELISEAEQQKWFRNIQQDQFQYFLIASEEQPVGMIHLAEINPLEKTAEAGLFIGDQRFSGTGIALGASLLLLDYAFGKLDLEKIKIKVKNSNTAAQQYNQLLGFRKDKSIHELFTQFILEKETYSTRRPELAKLVNL